MTGEQRREVERYFDLLHELPSGDRNAGIEAIGDEDVRSEVASLLGHSSGGETVAQVIEAMAAHAESSSVQDQHFGPYRLVRRLGNGGQGAVFEAVRDDGTFHQRVAIKIVKWEIDSDAARNQFRQERQILAGLEHPHIARLLDGGETANGTPYLVMEFIEGQPLTIATKGWPTRRKLEVFLQVAAAVSFAHANLIVHRDLKPGNILLSSHGTPKLLDFGIAKLLVHESQRTQTVSMALTPDYASPEQVRGAKITTASDVYSLGVVLYQLLTDRLPLEIRTTSLVELVSKVCHTEPAPAGVSADLDNILAMAMRKEPERRYASVREFADDVERSMNNRPVRARPDTLAYRTGRFILRNRLPLIAAMLIAATMLGGVIESQRQAHRAERRFQQVRQLANRFLFDFHDEIVKTPGTVKAREMIVSTALEYLNSLASDAAGDPGLQWELAVAYGKVAEVQGSPTNPSLGRTADALASYEKALGLAYRLAGQHRLDPTQRAAFVGLLEDASAVRVPLSQYKDSVRVAREAVEQSAGLPEKVQREALNRLSISLVRVGDLAGGLRAREQTIPGMRLMVERDPSFANRLDFTIALSNLGYAKARLTRFDEALADQMDALTRFRTLQAEATQAKGADGLAVHARTYAALLYIGQIFGAGDRASLGRGREAAKWYQQALAELGPIIAADGHDNGTRYNAGLAELNAALALSDIAPAEAVQHAGVAREIIDATSKNVDPRAACRIVEADAYRKLREFAQAETLLMEADRMMTARGTGTDADLNRVWANLEAARGNVKAAMPRFDRALQLYEEELAEMPTPGNAWLLARTLESVAAALPATAVSRRERIVAIWRDQNRRYPGIPYIEKHVAAAENAVRHRALTITAP